MSLAVRYLEFKQPKDLPGHSSITNIVAYDPTWPQQPRSYEIEYDPKQQLFRVAVPWDRVKQKGIGRWVHKDSGRPNFGLGRICYIPRDDCGKFELVSDAEEFDPTGIPEEPAG